MNNQTTTDLPGKRLLNASFRLCRKLLLPFVATGMASAVYAVEENQEMPQNQVSGSPQQQWISFVEQLRVLGRESYVALAAQLDQQSYEAELAAARSDLGLSLTGSHTEYPDGIGGDANNNTENLEKYSGVQLNFELLDQLLHRSSRIDAAKARMRQAEHEMSLQQEEAAMELAQNSATAWAEQHQYQALSQALTAVQRAKRRLKLSASASMPEITDATLENEAQVLILHSEVTSAFDGLSPFEPTSPVVPRDYTILPQRAPGSEDIVRLANNAPQTKMLEAEATALREEAEALRGNGVDLSLYAGQVFREGSLGGTSGDRDDSPQFGATLTIPLGASQANEADALKWRSKARRREAADALIQRQRDLIELRNNWSRSVAGLSRAIERMRQQQRLLSQMQARAAQPASGRAPQPWQLDIEIANFWLRVAETWEARGEWMGYLLSWSVMEPQFLSGRFNESTFSEKNAICAPLSECP